MIKTLWGSGSQWGGDSGVGLHRSNKDSIRTGGNAIQCPSLSGKKTCMDYERTAFPERLESFWAKGWPALPLTGQVYNQCSKHVLELQVRYLQGEVVQPTGTEPRVRWGLCETVLSQVKFRCVSCVAPSCPPSFFRLLRSGHLAPVAVSRFSPTATELC